jgi:hypothetical protein
MDIDYRKLAAAVVDEMAARLSGKATPTAKAPQTASQAAPAGNGVAMLYTVDAEGQSKDGVSQSGKPWQLWSFKLSDMQGKETWASTFSDSAANACRSIKNTGDRVSLILEANTKGDKTYHSFKTCELVDAKPAPEPVNTDPPPNADEPPF